MLSPKWIVDKKMESLKPRSGYHHELFSNTRYGLSTTLHFISIAFVIVFRIMITFHPRNMRIMNRDEMTLWNLLQIED